VTTVTWVPTFRATAGYPTDPAHGRSTGRGIPTDAPAGPYTFNFTAESPVMADVFRKQSTGYKLNGKPVPKGTPGAAAVTRQSKKWYGTVAGKHVPLSTDKQAARQLLAAFQTEAAKRSAGIGDPFAAHAPVPLVDHLEAWRADLIAKGTTVRHAALVTQRCKAAFAGCRFRRIADIDATDVQRFLAGLRDAGKSVQTVNFYLTAVKQFCRWLTLNRRAAASPVAHLTGGNVKLDRRHDRRDLSPTELAALVAAAAAGRTIRGTPGPDRAVLYTVAAFTGLRASELASLTPESFALTGDTPAVTVQAAYAKNRRADSIPLHPDLILGLAAWLAGKPTGEPVWPGKWAAQRTAGKALARDLAAARQAWLAAAPDPADRARREASDHLAYRDGAGRFADFHALRHTFISGLVATVPPKLAQELARHGSITLTFDRYAHVSAGDRAAAVRSLPGPCCTPVAQTACNTVQTGAVPFSETGRPGEMPNRPEVLQKPGFPAEREGFEPTVGASPTPVFKTGALNRSATSPTPHGPSSGRRGSRP